MIASARTIILDRDGVLNELGQDYIKDVKELNIISRSMVAINVLLERKHNVVIASNQAGVAKNLLNRATLKDIEHEFHKHISCKLNSFIAHTFRQIIVNVGNQKMECWKR